MAMFLVVLRRSGPRWDPSLALEQQEGFVAHAEFVDELVDRGIIILGGPLSDEIRVAYAAEADSEDALRAQLVRDPWEGTHLVIETIDPWNVRLDGRTP
ncbi:MAG TPA: hypothetical protein VN880_21975 [Solirubrobacteraceae bacterium]|jgi:uncharacterized protein YciI|nr:hypothetical protein [Solirubrobacteraceae bacterium]